MLTHKLRFVHSIYDSIYDRHDGFLGVRTFEKKAKSLIIQLKGKEKEGRFSKAAGKRG